MRIAVTNADRELVMGVVCDQYTVTRHELVSRCRVYDLAEARHVAMTILRGRGYSLQSIADTFNRANHGTVIAAVKRVADQASIDRKFADRWRLMMEAIAEADNHPANRVRLTVDFMVACHSEMTDADLLTLAAHKARQNGAVKIERVEAAKELKQ